MSVKFFISVAAMAAVTGLATTSALAQISISTVPVGNPGNAADPATGNLYGAVAYEYRIGTTEVTNAQYAAFLNAKAATDTFNLYNAEMAESYGGIIRSGAPGSYTYSTVAGRANHPVNWVSFWDATRFANWLHNGQGNGDTETGAYTLTAGGISANTVTRNAGWRWAVTSENEWYKAAYYQPASAGGDTDNYWAYPNSGNSIPTIFQANCNNFPGNTTPVGSYSANYVGASDMGGNVFEWNESVFEIDNRGYRGGSFGSGDIDQGADFALFYSPTVEDSLNGFRVVMASSPTAVCDDIDFNNNTVFPEDQDVIDFFDVLAGGSPATCDPVQGCNDIDFNNNGVFPEDQDVIDFFNVLAGGTCS